MKRSTRGVRIVQDRLEQAISVERILVCVVVAWESHRSSNQPSSTGLRHVGHDDARNFQCRRRCVAAAQCWLWERVSS